MKWLDRTWGQTLAFSAAALCAFLAVFRSDAAAAPVLLTCAFLVTGLSLRALAVWRLHVRNLGRHLDRVDEIARRR